MGFYFCEHLASLLCQLVAVVLLVHEACQLIIAVGGVDVVFALPIEFSQVLQYHCLGKAVLRALLDTFLPCIDGLHGIALGQVDVADGIIDAVQVVGVVGVLGHTPQPSDDGLPLSLGHHLGLHDTCVKSQFVRRILAYALAQGAVGLFLLSCQLAELSKEVVETCFLQTSLGVADAIAQGFDGRFILFRGNQISGSGGIQFALSLAGDAVAADLAEYIFGIVGPVEQHIASCQSCTCHAGHGRLTGIQLHDVVIAGSRLDEFALPELCIGEHHPCVAQIGVELAACEEGFLLVRHLAAGFLRFILDGMPLDGFLAFLDGRLEVAFADVGCLLAGNDVHGKQFGIVVHMPFLLCFDALVESDASVIECVEASCRAVVEARAGIILLCGARSKESCHKQEKEKSYRGRAFHYYI